MHSRPAEKILMQPDAAHSMPVERANPAAGTKCCAQFPSSCDWVSYQLGASQAGVVEDVLRPLLPDSTLLRSDAKGFLESL